MRFTYSEYFDHARHTTEIKQYSYIVCGVITLVPLYCIRPANFKFRFHELVVEQQNRQYGSQN